MYSEEYTAEDERQLQSEWNADPLGTHMLNHGKSSVMLRLWKLTQRLRPGIYPETIISEVNMLEFEHVRVRTKVKNREGKDVPHPYWSKNFCIALEMLLVHPFWDSQLSTMVLYIQYAVMCRTNDQRRQQWPREILKATMLWLAFCEVTFAQLDGNQTIVEFHRRALDWVRNKSSPQATSFESQLLQRIEHEAFRDATRPFKPRDPDAPFKVRSTDLEVVIKALNSMTANGAALYQAAQWYHQVYSDARPPHQAAPSEATLGQYREKVLLDMRRAKVKANNNGTATVKGMTMPPLPQTLTGSSGAPERRSRSKSMDSTVAAMTRLAVRDDKIAPAPQVALKDIPLSPIPTTRIAPGTEIAANVDLGGAPIRPSGLLRQRWYPATFLSSVSAHDFLRGTKARFDDDTNETTNPAMQRNGYTPI